MPKTIHGKPVKSVRIYIYETQYEELSLLLGGQMTTAFNVLAQGLISALHKNREATLARLYSKGLTLESIIPMENDNG